MNTIDLAAVKDKQRATWATGDYASIAPLIVPISEDLAEAIEPQAGWKVLDVATGSGNAALAAARRNAEVTGLDYVPALLERAKVRAAAEGLKATWVEGDAENLPFADGAFDAVTSVFGCMFAPDQQRTARELARVCKQGGRIGLASWTPGGFVGELFKAVSGYNPPPPGLTPPVLWGTDTHLAKLFAGLARPVKCRARTFLMRHVAPEAYVDYFSTYFGPVIKAREAIGPDRWPALRKDMVALAAKFDKNQRPGGPIAIAAEYLETVLVCE